MNYNCLNLLHASLDTFQSKQGSYFDKLFCRTVLSLRFVNFYAIKLSPVSTKRIINDVLHWTDVQKRIEDAAVCVWGGGG